MAEHHGDVDILAFQRHIATLLLEQVGPVGFALAGSSAIREHGITERPTHDIDLFTTTSTSSQEFTEAVTDAERILVDHGYQVTRVRSTPEFARLLVHAGPDTVVEVDFGFDWRSEPPAQLAIGPVLAIGDAVGSKVAAVYSRGEVRDFLDLDAIRRSGGFPDRHLLLLAHDHDPGFDTLTFSRQLRRVETFGPIETTEYGIDANRFDAIKRRILNWADQLAVSAARFDAYLAAPTRSVERRISEQARPEPPNPWQSPAHGPQPGPEPPGR